MYVSLFICLLCVCNFSLHLKKRFWSYMYLGECPKIEYGRHFHGNQPRKFFCFVFISIFFHTDHNKYTMKWLGWKMSYNWVNDAELMEDRYETARARFLYIQRFPVQRRNCHYSEIICQLSNNSEQLKLIMRIIWLRSPANGCDKQHISRDMMQSSQIDMATFTTTSMNPLLHRKYMNHCTETKINNIINV